MSSLMQACADSPQETTVAFKNAMRQLAGGVSVITASCGEERTGMTVTSVISISLDPPELVVSVNREASSWPMIDQTRRFGVNILGAGQLQIGERFSGKGGIKGEQRYEGAPWQQDEHGVWYLPDALAALSCEVETIWVHRTHNLVVGRVRAVYGQLGGDGPLTYWNGRFGTFEP